MNYNMVLYLHSTVREINESFNAFAEIHFIYLVILRCYKYFKTLSLGDITT